MAFEVAFDNKERMVKDVQFHPILRQRGLSDHEIETLTATLHNRRKIKRQLHDEAWANFEISKPVFLEMFLKTVPKPTINKAHELYKSWRRPGGGEVSAARLAAELNLPEFESEALFDACAAGLA